MRAPRARTGRGDWRDWRVVLACLGCQIGMGAGGYLFPVFLKPIAEDLGWSRTTYAIANPIMSTGVAVVGPLVGWLAERSGPRAVLVFGSALMGAALWGAANMQTSLEFYAIAIAVGIAVACLGDLPTAAAIAPRFRERQGTALAVVYVGSNVGGALGSLAAAWLAAAGSWRSAFTAMAIAMWALVLPSAIAVGSARRAPEGASARDAAADEEPSPRARPGAARPTPPSDGAPGAADGVATGAMDAGAALRSRDFWLLFAALFAFYFYRLGVNAHLVALLSDRGWSQGDAALGFGLTLALGILGKLGAGAIADRVGVRTAVVGNFTGLFAAACLLLSPGDWLAVPTFLVLHGVTTAAEDVVVPLLIARRFGAAHLPRIYGLLLLALVPGGYVGPVAAGSVFDATGSYEGVFALFAASNLVALAAIWLVASARGARERAGAA